MHSLLVAFMSAVVSRHAVASAARLRKLATYDAGAVVNLTDAKAPLTDVTRIVESASFKKSGYRCCCDKRKSWKDDVFRRGDRTGWCTVAFTEKCGSVSITPSSPMAHEYKNTDGKCDILESEVEDFFATHGTTEDYCVESRYSFRGGTVVIPPATLGQMVKFTCPSGWRPSHGQETVECRFNGSSAGAFTSARCERIQKSSGGRSRDSRDRNRDSRDRNRDSRDRNRGPGDRNRDSRDRNQGRRSSKRTPV